MKRREIVQKKSSIVLYCSSSRVWSGRSSEKRKYDEEESNIVKKVMKVLN